MIEIKSEIKTDLILIQPVGRLDGLTSKKFLDETQNLLKSNPKKVIINLDSLDYISSEGLRSLLTTAKNVKSHQGNFTLCAAQSSVKEVLEISGFGNMLGLYDTVELAEKNI